MPKKAKKVIDQNGVVFRSTTDACDAYGIPFGGLVTHSLRRGEFVRGNIRLKYYEEPDTPVHADLSQVVPASATGSDDPLWKKMKARYSDKELEQIANGQGIDKRKIVFPEIHLEGKHHKMVVISDTHIGSVYSPDVWHETVSNFVNNSDVECVLHCGDLVDGLKIGRAGTQIYELSEIGFEAQRDKAIELMSKYDKPIYIISGNHDFYFQEFAGANIVKSVCEAVPNMTYVGHDSADIKIDGCTIRLFHGTDGSSYALSYRLQKIVEGINGGHKPNILLAGHVHKMCYIFSRNIHAVSVPCMQKQTKFMEGKKLEAHTGFLLLEFDTIGSNLCNFKLTYYPFYA